LLTALSCTAAPPVLTNVTAPVPLLLIADATTMPFRSGVVALALSTSSPGLLAVVPPAVKMLPVAPIVSAVFVVASVLKKPPAGPTRSVLPDATVSVRLIASVYTSEFISVVPADVVALPELLLHL